MTSSKNAKLKSPKVLQSVFERLLNEYKDPSTELTYESPFQLLVAVILSAQCTDARVNHVTPLLFKKYPTADKLAKAQASDVETIIHSCGFFRQKARSILSTSQDLLAKFKGQVPSTLEELITLKGVGRKTASVILNQAFDQPAIAVDTHVKRVAHRLGWTNHTDPVKVEFDLRELLPKDWWSSVNGFLILHGRRTCGARKPDCDHCVINDACHYYMVSRKRT